MSILTQNPARLVTGLVLLAVLGTALSLGGSSMFVLIAVFSSLGLWEFFTMLLPDGGSREEKAAGLLAGFFALGLAWCCPGSGVLPLGLALLLLALLYLSRWSRRAAPSFVSVSVLVAGIVYVPGLLAPALSLRPAEQFLLVAITIASDTAAYFCGLRFGKHKIWPRVSPNKSLEGSAAGLAASVLVCLGFGFTLAENGTSALFILMGLLLGVMAQLGDFFESALKRGCGVKDSGTLLPGHGGVLDRIDSLLFVTPAYALFRLFHNLF